MFKLFPILIVVVGFQQIESACKTCNKHEFACVDKDKFQICIDGKIDETVTLQCKSGEICTDLAMACVPEGYSTAVPGCSSDCGVCAAGKTFACIGRNTYELCQEGKLAKITGTCPGDKVCDTAGTSICARPCDVKSIICDKDVTTTTSTTTTPVPIITTTSPLPISPLTTSTSPSSSPLTTQTSTPITTITPTPTTIQTPSLTPNPTPEPNKLPQTVCNEKQNPGRYPLNNGTCNQDYVYCRIEGTNLVGISSKCPSGRTFNANTQSCEISPAGCNV